MHTPGSPLCVRPGGAQGFWGLLFVTSLSKDQPQLFLPPSRRLTFILSFRASSSAGPATLNGLPPPPAQEAGKSAGQRPAGRRHRDSPERQQLSPLGDLLRGYCPHQGRRKLVHGHSGLPRSYRRSGAAVAPASPTCLAAEDLRRRRRRRRRRHGRIPGSARPREAAPPVGEAGGMDKGGWGKGRQELE
jgi:hypothetical protein